MHFLHAAMSPREVLRIGVQGGAKNLGRDDIGQIAPGFAADFIAYDTLAHTGAFFLYVVLPLVVGREVKEAVLEQWRMTLRGGLLHSLNT